MTEKERAEARKALEEAQQGPFIISGNEILQEKTDKDGYRLLMGKIGKRDGWEKDIHMFANAPTWLRNALERERLLIEEREQGDQAYEECKNLCILLQKENAELDDNLKKLQKRLDRELELNEKLVEKTTAHMAEQDKEIQLLMEHLEACENPESQFIRDANGNLTRIDES